MNFDEINQTQLSVIVKTGNLSNLPQEYQEYYSIMEKVRGLRAKSVYNGKIINKAGIIRLLKTEYQINEYTARKIYDDSLNFFYTQDNVKPEAFANLYADRLDDAATLAMQNNQLDLFEKLTMSAAKLRGCFEKKPIEIPQELYRKQTVLYTTDVEDIGGIPEDLKELERQLDALPEIPVIKLERAKMEAGITKFDILKMAAEDADSFIDQDEDKKD